MEAGDDVSYDQVTKWSHVETATVVFPQFHESDDTKGHSVVSEDFQCHGYPWAIEFYPGGNLDAEDGQVSLYLSFEGNGSVHVRCWLRPLGRSRQLRMSTLRMNACCPASVWVSKMAACALPFWMLEGGDQCINVEIQVEIPKPMIGFTPKASNWQSNMSRLLQSGTGADVAFDLGPGHTIRAHSYMLMAQAPLLYKMVKEPANGQDPSPVPIEHTSAGTFNDLLLFLYTGNATRPQDMEATIEMVEVANKFAIIELKLIMEKHLADNFINSQSVIELLLLAKSSCCALFREEAVAVAAKHYVYKRLKRRENWRELKECNDLLVEILDKSNDVGPDDDLAKLSVRQIYEELESLGVMPIDGTRKMLVETLLEKREEAGSTDNK